MLKLIGRTLAVIAVAGALTYGTNLAVNAGNTGSSFGGEREEHEFRERNIDPNSLTIKYPAVGVAAGLAPTVIKLGLLGVAVVQGRKLFKRKKGKG